MSLSLKQKINNNNGEINIIKESIDALNLEVIDEAATRLANDTTLQTNIDTKEDIILIKEYTLNTSGTLYPYLMRIFDPDTSTNSYGIRPANKFHVHLEAEGLEVNKFGFCTGTGAPSSQNFGIYTPSSWLTKFYYSVCKYDVDANEILSGTASIKLQLFIDGVAKDCYCDLTFADLSLANDRRKTGYFKNLAGDILVDVSQNSTDASNYVNNGFWSFKVIEISGFDSNTRHRFNVQYENTS